ncbi:hypothetical protein ACLOJK_035974, partial [Asimina triloba]
MRCPHCHCGRGSASSIDEMSPLGLLAKSWTAAAGTLGKSAECFKKIGYYKEAAKLFMEAGEASLKIFDKDAMYYFNQAVEQLIESNEVLLAAKCCERIGYLYKCSRQYDHSLLFYKRWVDLCEATQDTFLITRSKHEVEAVTRRLKGWGPWGDFDIEDPKLSEMHRSVVSDSGSTLFGLCYRVKAG